MSSFEGSRKESESAEPTHSAEVLENHELVDVHLTAIQERARKMTETLDADSQRAETLLQELELDDDPNAQAFQAEYQSKLSNLSVRVHRTLLTATLAGGILFGGAHAFAGESLDESNDENEEVVEEVVDEQAEKKQVEVPVVRESLDEDSKEPNANNDPPLVEKLAVLSPETREMKEMIERVIGACYGEEKSCLKEVVSAAAAGMIRNHIPFKSGLSSLRENAQDKTLTSGEHFLGAIKGVAMILRDVALFSSGAGIVKFAQVYRAVNLASDAKDAVTFYAKNKKEVDIFLGLVFKGNDTDRARVQEKIDTEVKGQHRD